jgi:flagellar biosynthesis protein FlhG
MHIIPIASGKGGVGKSLFAANLAIALGQAGKKVILSDLDLGGSNLHLILGIRRAISGVGIFLNESRPSLTDYIIPTQYKNLQFLPGDSEIPGIANLTAAQKRKLINQLNALDTDYLILDLGAGSNYNTIDFFLLSGAGTIITTPTPTALVNAYVFLKNTMFRILNSSCKKGTPADKYLRSLEKNSSSLQRVYMMDLLKKIQEIDPDSYDKFNEIAKRFHPRLVMNMLEDPKDSERAQKLRRSCREYLGFDPEHLGIMYRDDLQDTALSSGLPIIIYKPKAVLSQAIYRIADKLLQFELEEDQHSLLSSEETTEESFETANMEAQIDFQARIEYLEELLHTGALSTGDLLETVKNQQLEINQLKKENILYKSKLVKAAQQGYRL